jgi:hypothetical protein
VTDGLVRPGYEPVRDAFAAGAGTGVLGFPGQTDLLSFDGTGWDDYDAIAAGLAQPTPPWHATRAPCRARRSWVATAPAASTSRSTS